MNITLGSLFDGIGGFPYAGTLLGIKPIWASEIESFPIRVTEHHFPNMKHLGDITQINGGEIEPVDIITFGSPCQDLSVAGKREGLAGARSGLFMEAVRIIREMRTATDGQYPRFAVWENVPGAFSSNKGEDFRAVLEEIAEAEIPMPGSGKWANAGMVRTGNCDVAWRTLDAQHWGVPQRRRRIFLVADFGGQCAGEILFIEEGLRGDFAESGETREETAGDVGDGTAKPISIETFHCESRLEIAYTLKARDYKDPQCVAFTQNQRAQDHAVAIVDCRNLYENKELSGTLQCKQTGGHSLNYQNPVRVGYKVRRLTPTECLRLQGYPDWWLDIEGMTDTQKYKAIGNSVAIPCVVFVLGRIADVFRKSITA